MILLTFLLCSSFGYSQSKYFFGVSTGVVFTTDNGLSSSVPGAEFNNKPDIIFPAQAGVYINDKRRVRLDLSGFRMKSKLNYNYRADQTGDPSVPSHSDISIKTETVNLNYDHWVAGTEKIQVYASAGLRALFSTNKKETTTYADGREAETELHIQEFNRNIFGVGAGVVAKYNHTDTTGFTFTPDYAYYFGGFNKRDNNNLNLLHFAIGVEYRL